MSAQPIHGTPVHASPTAEWFFRLGLHEPAKLAKQLAAAVSDDPFEVIGFTAITVNYFGSYFEELVDWLAEHEPTLGVILPTVAAVIPAVLVNDPLELPAGSDQATLPQWLRELDKIECTGIMRRYDLADRSCSSYLIEARLADGQVATARLAIDHDGVGHVSEFWTTAFSLHEAATFYRTRYALYTTRPYRRVKLETACARIDQAMSRSINSGQIFEALDHPIPWPQNAAVLLLMLRPGMPKTELQHGD